MKFLYGCDPPHPTFKKERTRHYVTPHQACGSGGATIPRGLALGQCVNEDQNDVLSPVHVLLMNVGLEGMHAATAQRLMYALIR